MKKFILALVAMVATSTIAFGQSFNYNSRRSTTSSYGYGATGTISSRARDDSTLSYNYGSGHTIQTGSRGGQYYVNSRGNQVYVPKRY